MRIDLTLAYLIRSFFSRLIGFFIHWYINTYFIFKERVSSLKKIPLFYWPALLLAIIIYFVWALIPIWLVVRVFYVVEL